MRHRIKSKKFGRVRGQRKAFMRSLATDLILKGRIETTEARAKALRPIVEKAVTRSKKDSLANRRLLISRLHNKKAVEKLFENLGPRYEDRPGGYVRIIKTDRTRKRDGVHTAIIEFV